MRLMNRDDRLDAIALVRAHIKGDSEAMRAILDHSGQGMYLAVLHFAAALVETHAEGSAEDYLDQIVADLTGGHDDE